MMNDDRSLENELWDDACLETGKLLHFGCGGRVFWIWGEEFRCIKCCEKVTITDVEVPDGETANTE